MSTATFHARDVDARHSATTPLRPVALAEQETSAPAPVGPTPANTVPLMKAGLFVAGCVLLVLAAANLSNLGQWSDRWGQIPVVLVFFLVMSIAGRWFWTGADAILARVIGNR
ncbi:hypothetical protein ACLTEW_20070 [Gordonia lacunae]|uniref:hypothetical protein n=1 Tax=Gordonia lacunae TaxID=417102 RepID=UPI001FC9B5EC|nr:hypothetical protein [Gordonia lacunae]